MEMPEFLLGGLIRICQQTGPVKSLDKKFEQIKQKIKHFIYVRDAIEREKIKQLLGGKMPRRECKEWLDRAEEIVHEVDDIVKNEGKISDFKVFSQKRIQEQLMKLIGEITDQLEKSIEHGLMIDAPRIAMKRTNGPNIRGHRFGPAKIDIHLERKPVVKANPVLGSETSSAKRDEVTHGREMLQRKDGKTLVPPLTEASNYVIEGKKTCEIEAVEAETVVAAKETSDKTPAVAGASVRAAVEHGINPLPEMKTSYIYETGSGIVHSVPESLDVLQETKNVEIDPDAISGIFSPFETEIEPVLSENDEVQLSSFASLEAEPVLSEREEAHTKPTSVEPFIPVVEPPYKEYETSSINVVKGEISHLTPGGQASTEPVASYRRSIYFTVQKILDYMRSGAARRVGIYGLGGSGKTTVLTALFHHKETKNIFDSVIWVDVSRYSSSRKIKDQVAKQLLTHPVDSDTNLEAIIGAIESKNVLLLLDDVWEGIDLDEMGISNPNIKDCCRIILTTRSLDVCNVMEVDTKLELEVLSREDAWELFHEQVGGIIDSQEIKPYAQALVAACEGLPLTIIVTGKALRKENDVSTWKNALTELLLPSTRRKHGSETVIQQLKFSYGKLKTRDVKDCFLYCSLLREDLEVSISDLINHFIDEGLVSGSLGDVVEKGHNIIKILLEASLLEITDNCLYVKMHDVVRDLASAIMSPEVEGCQFLVRSDLGLTQVEDPKRDSLLFPGRHQFLLGAGAGIREPPEYEKWEQATMIFLMDNELFSIPESPSCPKLLTLFLQRNRYLRNIPTSFFEGTPDLQVLNLSKTRIKSLPQSLFKLKSLKVLLLRDCERLSVLPHEIGNLEHLELLDLRGTEIYNLPDDIGKLSCLKHMVVSFYGSNNNNEYVKLPQKLVSNGIISGFSRLSELSITIYPGDQRWSKCVDYMTTELLGLKKLDILDFYFPEVKLLDIFVQESLSWKGKGLTKFKFIVGHNVKRSVAHVPAEVEIDYNQQDRCLRFVNGETLPNAVEEVLFHTTAFYLDHHLTVCKLSEFGVSNINALEFCILRECPGIDVVLDGSGVEGSALPFLKHLSIHYLWNLKKIWQGPVPPGSLSRLRFLSINTCPMLPFILTCSMLQTLSNLEVLIVEDCESVENVVVRDDDVDSGDIILPKLKKLRLHYLPKLVRIWKGSWPSIEHLSFYDCPKLESLHVSFNLINSIKEIKAEKMWWDELDWDETALFLQLQVYRRDICYEDL